MAGTGEPGSPRPGPVLTRAPLLGLAGAHVASAHASADVASPMCHNPDPSLQALASNFLKEPALSARKETYEALGLPPEKQKQPEQNRVSQILKRLGWYKARRTITLDSGSRGQRNVYCRPIVLPVEKGKG